MALNVAKSLNRNIADSPTQQACEDVCETYLHWDLGLVGLEKLLIQPNDMLGTLLTSRGVEYFKIDQLIQAAKSIFPFRSIRAGKELTIVTDLLIQLFRHLYTNLILTDVFYSTSKTAFASKSSKKKPPPKLKQLGV